MKVNKFSEILENFMESKRHELHELRKQTYGDNDERWFYWESKYMRYFLTWFKENGVIPVVIQVKHEAIDPKDNVPELRASIKKEALKYKDECDKISEEIGLKSLKLENRLPHCSPWEAWLVCGEQCEKEEYVVIDNPCTGDHVIRQLAVPVAFLKKCLVLGCVPAIEITQETNHA